ncbi:hypothetical protein LSH36_566g00020 [Paralvinella palmiformis]|uniref:Sulfatase N-terminal domain-containing protein n=1 Tax=Paralvinella palmiformis TaxID=53620 RepID=A0AAD9J5S4_9ANNE|nr:hypothetical protein LSH36_566g00020 [Paralvinella palmiformis]
MASGRGRNGIFWILIGCVFIVYFHYVFEVGIFPGQKEKGTLKERLAVKKFQNDSEPLKAPINFIVQSQDASSVRAERRMSDEPRSSRGRHPRMNVLFIMADDMRAQLSPYNGPDSEYMKPRLHTPNFQNLASRSLLLKKAFVQYTFCGPSRTSMLTSRRPDITGIFNNSRHWRYERGNYTSLPQYFKMNDYTVQGIGKVFHPGKSSSNDDPVSWTEPYRHGLSTEPDYLKPFGPGERWLEVSPEEEEEKPLPDRAAVQIAKEFLEAAAEKARSGEKNFFLGFGFNKPHVSLICPKKYYNLYPEETGKFMDDPLWQLPFFRPGSGIVNGTALNDSWYQLPTETLRHMRQGYFACISYVDDLLGELLNAVEELDLADSTIISFMADHGYHLGEQRMVGKQTLYDSSSHVPMMLHIPGRTEHGIVSESIVQALDVFPTIVEAAGLDQIPPCREDSVDIPLCTEGTSILKLIDDPEIQIRPYAITQQMDANDRMRFSLRNKRQERFNLVNDQEYADIKDKLQKSLYMKIGIEV